jgi:hypothetical protein
MSQLNTFKYNARTVNDLENDLRALSLYNRNKKYSDLTSARYTHTHTHTHMHTHTHSPPSVYVCS